MCPSHLFISHLGVFFISINNLEHQMGGAWFPIKWHIFSTLGHFIHFRDLYISHFNSDIDIWSFLECRGMSWLQVCQVLNLSELPLWIYMSLYASTPRRTGFIFNLGCITSYINFTTFAVKYFYTRIHSCIRMDISVCVWGRKCLS